jgi:hypothetical protein
MRQVLFDMQLAEAIVETSSGDFRLTDDRQALYDAVFRKHNISQAQFDSALVWYGKNLDLYMQVYKLVLKDVNAAINNLGDIKPNPLSGEVSARDSIDVWISQRNFYFAPEHHNLLTFNIQPKLPYSTGSAYVLSFNVWGINNGMNHLPKIALHAEQNDTIVSVFKDVTADGSYDVLLQSVNTKQVKRVFGFMLLNSDDDAALNRIYLDNIKLMKYNYGSKAIKLTADSLLNTSL